MAVRLPPPKPKASAPLPRLPVKSKPVFHCEEPPAGSVFDERVGPYRTKDDVHFTHYSIAFSCAKNDIVQALEDKGHKVLVELRHGTCIYVDSDQFEESFERAVI